MSAKDFKSKPSVRGWVHPQDADVAGKSSARDTDLEETVRAGLKIYRFELAVSEPVSPFSTMSRRKSIN